MTNREKIEKIRDLLDTVGDNTDICCLECYRLLEEMGDMKHDYGEYMRSAPIDCDRELERLPGADYDLSAALLTMLLRADHFSEGSFEERWKNGQVVPILEHMTEILRQDTQDS